MLYATRTLSQNGVVHVFSSPLLWLALQLFQLSDTAGEHESTNQVLSSTNQVLSNQVLSNQVLSNQVLSTVHGACYLVLTRRNSLKLPPALIVSLHPTLTKGCRVTFRIRFDESPVNTTL